MINQVSKMYYQSDDSQYEYETCSERFWSKDDCYEHMEEWNHWPECETCPKTFRTCASRDQHIYSLDHWAERFECETCNNQYLSQDAAYCHMNEAGHWAPEFECEVCSRRFYTQQSADQHMEAKGHYQQYCQSCNIRFQSKNNLKMVSTRKYSSNVIF